MNSAQAAVTLEEQLHRLTVLASGALTLPAERQEVHLTCTGGLACDTCGICGTLASSVEP